MGGIFHPVALSVTHGSNQTKIATSHSAKALRIARNSGYVAKAFSSNGAKARLSGGHVYITAKCPIASSGFGTARSPLHMLAKLPITFSLKADTLTPAPTQHGLFFTPINPKEDPPTLPFDQMGPSYRLFRHYKSRPCGRNVYIYSDDTVNEYDPDGYTTLWRESDRTSSTNLNAPHVVHVFWGGHEGELVTPHEAALLTAAGYIVT
jgi:hypothetical protein